MQATSESHESTRLAYLQAMGVTCWLPLPNKLKSLHGPVFVARKDNTSASMQKETAININNHTTFHRSINKREASKQYQSLTQLFEVMHAPSAPEHNVAPTQQSPLSDENTVDDIRLSLCWYAPSVLVINEIPIQDGAAMSSSIAQLQTAIVNALAIDVPQIMPKAQIEFYWPLVPGPYGDRSQSGGQQALAYQLKRLLMDKPVSRVLLLGERCVDLLPDWQAHTFGEVVNARQCFSEITTDEQVQVLLSYSLHQLLAIPSKKAEAWQHMQSLLKPIS